MSKEKNIPQVYPIYDTVYGTEIPCEQYYVIKFDTLPSKFINNISYDPSIIDYLKENGLTVVTNYERQVPLTCHLIDKSSVNYNYTQKYSIL